MSPNVQPRRSSTLRSSDPNGLTLTTFCLFYCSIVYFGMAEKVSGLLGLGIRAVDTFSVAPLSPNTQRGHLFRTITCSREAKRNRLIAGVQLVDSVIPGFNTWMARTVTDTSKFPASFPSEIPSFAGGENTIFSLFETEDAPVPKAVLKVNRATIGLPPLELTRIARKIREEYEAIREWYKPVTHFVPEEYMIILHSHLLGAPAVGTIQAYIPGDFRGVFEDFTTEELLYFLHDNSQLANRFYKFGERFLSQWYDTGTCIDILGPNNVSIVKPEDQGRLLLVDPHVVLSYDALKGHKGNPVERLTDRIRHIEELVAAI